MKKMYKAMLLVLCAALLVAGSVLGTLAYLKDSKTITNTMSVGSVTITMDETDVDVYGVKDGETRVAANEYKLIPGHTYVKDPVIHVTAGSEACYVFVKVENQIAAIEDSNNSIAKQLGAYGWVQLEAGSTVWYKATAIDARNSTADIDVAVFTSFTIAGTADVSTYTGKTIKITGYAIQADGFADARAAWAASGFGA